MKARKFGLPGSVTVIGFVYALALAFGPTPGLSAPGGQTASDRPATLAAGGPTSAVCPHVAHAEYVMARLMQAHRGLLKQADDVPMRPAWGTGNLTSF